MAVLTSCPVLSYRLQDQPILIQKNHEQLVSSYGAKDRPCRCAPVKNNVEKLRCEPTKAVGLTLRPNDA